MSTASSIQLKQFLYKQNLSNPILFNCFVTPAARVFYISLVLSNARR